MAERQVVVPKNEKGNRYSAIAVIVDPELKRRFKVMCVTNGHNMTDVILDHIKSYVNSDQKQAG